MTPKNSGLAETLWCTYSVVHHQHTKNVVKVRPPHTQNFLDLRMQLMCEVRFHGQGHHMLPNS